MERDVSRFPCATAAVPADQVVAFSTFAELDEFTYLEAGCVGEYWTDLMVSHLPALKFQQSQMLARGNDLGKALHMVNIIRDVASDLRVGRCLWPVELLSAHGLTPAQLAALAAPGRSLPTPEQAAALRRISADLHQRALALASSGLSYLQAVPAAEVRWRLATTWFLLLGLDTLTALGPIGSPLFCPMSRVKAPRKQVYEMLARSSLAALLDARPGHPGDRLDWLCRTRWQTASASIYQARSANDPVTSAARPLPLMDLLSGPRTPSGGQL
jgi:farnesyl-diphosphate farnesyltransferase